MRVIISKNVYYKYLGKQLIVKLHHLFILLAFGVNLIFICEATAEKKTITFATEEWKDATHKDGTGLYWDVLRAVYESQGYKIKPLIRSYKGSVKLIKTKKIDAMIGAYINEIKEGIYPKNHFAVDVVLAVYKKRSKFQWIGVETIRGKKVSWIDGYFYHEYLPESIVNSISIRRVDDRETGFRLLNLSQIDFYIDAQGDVKDFFIAKSGYHLEDFLMENVLELKLYVVFIDSPKGKALANLFDKEFTKLLTTGQIKSLYNSYRHSNFTIPSDFLN